MAKSLAGLVATVSANPRPFDQGMAHVAAKAQQTARQVNNTKMQANLQNSQAIQKLSDVRSRIDRLKTIPPAAVRVDTRGAMAQLQGLRRSMGALGRGGSGIARLMPLGHLAAAGPVGVGAAVGIAMAGLAANAAAATMQTARLGSQLGISAQAMAGLQHAANLAHVEQGAMTSSLTTMLRNVQLATEGNEQQAASLQRIGLSAAQLAGLSTDQQFSMIVDRLSQMGDQTARAAAAVSIFGESGRQLAPLLNRGSEGLAAAAEEAERLGLTMSPDQIARLQKSHESIVRLQAAARALGNDISIALTPVVEGLTGVISRLVLSFQGLIPQLDAILSRLGMNAPSGTSQTGMLWNAGIAYAMGGGMTSPFGGQQAAILNGVSQAISFLAATTAGGGAASGGISIPGSAAVSGMGQLASSLQSQVAAGGASPFAAQIGALNSQFNTQLATLHESAMSSIQELMAEQAMAQAALEALPPLLAAGPIGMALQAQADSAEAAMAELSAVTNAQTEALTKQFQQHQQIAEKMQQQLQILQRREQMEARAVQIVQGLQSPLQVFQNSIAELQRLQEAGLLSPTDFNMAAASAFQALQSSVPQGSTAGPGALLSGSAQAQDAINRFMRQTTGRTPEEEIRDTVRQALMAQNRTATAAEETARALARTGVIALAPPL